MHIVRVIIFIFNLRDHEGTVGILTCAILEDGRCASLRRRLVRAILGEATTFATTEANERWTALSPCLHLNPEVLLDGVDALGPVPRPLPFALAAIQPADVEELRGYARLLRRAVLTGP